MTKEIARLAMPEGSRFSHFIIRFHRDPGSSYGHLAPYRTTLLRHDGTEMAWHNAPTEEKARALFDNLAVHITSQSTRSDQ